MPVHDREGIRGPADVALVVGVVAGLVVIAVDGDPEREQTFPVVVAGAQDHARGAGVGAYELDLVDRRAHRLAVLRAQAGTVALRERLGFRARALAVSAAVRAAQPSRPGHGVR